MSNEALNPASCQTAVMLSFFSLFFVRLVYFYRLTFKGLQYFNKILTKYFVKYLHCNCILPYLCINKKR